MRSATCLLNTSLTLLVLSAARASDRPGEYLTVDGQLKDRVEVRELQGGIVGFTGTYYAIEADGSWSSGRISLRSERETPKDKGKLTKEQLAGLAEELARFKMASLPNHGETEVNPRVLEIRFGKRTSVLQPNPGVSLAEEDKAIRARYEGIVEAVHSLCKGPK